MIFSSNVGQGLAENTFVNLKIMLVYEGSQPNILDFVVNFNDYKWTGSKVLQAYVNVDLLGSPFSARRYRIVKNSASGTDYGAFSKKSGTAAWAVLMHENLVNDLVQINSGAGSINFLRNITDTDAFMIVPVSDLSDNGVLRFSNLNFTHPHVSGSDAIETFVLEFISE
jgi:hypothetical protein